MKDVKTENGKESEGGKEGEVERISRNRSPKGHMWSAIPVALLCMILNWSERKQGSGPEGDDVL